MWRALLTIEGAKRVGRPGLEGATVYFEEYSPRWNALSVSYKDKPLSSILSTSLSTYKGQPALINMEEVYDGYGAR